MRGGKDRRKKLGEKDGVKTEKRERRREKSEERRLGKGGGRG